MTRLDDFLLDRIFEPFSHKIQMKSGKTCYFLAKVSTYLGCISSITYVMYLVLFTKYPFSDILPIFSVNIVLVFLFLKMTEIFNRADHFSQNEHYRTKNDSRIKHFFMRMILVFSVAFYALALFLYSAKPDVSQVFAYLFLVCFFFMISLYFYACTPLPKSLCMATDKLPDGCTIRSR